jgi:hypothetical protein
MLARVRGRLTYANVIASLALFVALGGTGYAALRLPRNSVGPAQMSVRLRSVRPRCAPGLSRLERSMTARSESWTSQPAREPRCGAAKGRPACKGPKAQRESRYGWR